MDGGGAGTIRQVDISNWQIFSSLVTAAGVLVALGIAIAGTTERGIERSALQEAEARLLRIYAVGRFDSSDSGLYTGPPAFEWTVSNLGPHGVFDVVCEAWMVW